VLLVSWVLVVCKGSRETWAKQGRWAFRAFQEFLARLAPWASKVHSAQRGSLARLVCVANKERQALQACVAHLEPLVLLVQLVFVVRQVLQALKVKWGQQV